MAAAAVGRRRRRRWWRNGEGSIHRVLVLCRFSRGPVAILIHLVAGRIPNVRTDHHVIRTRRRLRRELDIHLLVVGTAHGSDRVTRRDRPVRADEAGDIRRREGGQVNGAIEREADAGQVGVGRPQSIVPPSPPGQVQPSAEGHPVPSIVQV